MDTSAESNTTTIIIGAGVVDPCTAYYVSKAVDKVMVVDAADKALGATSSTDTEI